MNSSTILLMFTEVFKVKCIPSPELNRLSFFFFLAFWAGVFGLPSLSTALKRRTRLLLVDVQSSGRVHLYTWTVVRYDLYKIFFDSVLLLQFFYLWPFLYNDNFSTFRYLDQLLRISGFEYLITRPKMYSTIVLDNFGEAGCALNLEILISIIETYLSLLLTLICTLIRIGLEPTYITTFCSVLVAISLLSAANMDFCKILLCSLTFII